MISRCLLLVLALLLTGAAERPPAPPSLPPEQAAREGRALVAEILAQQPVENVTNSGTLRIRQGRRRVNIPVTCEVRIGEGLWQTVYSARFEGTAGAEGSRQVEERLVVTHSPDKANTYEHTIMRESQSGARETLLSARPSGAETMAPFAGSDFWLADLGLEFFHWPEQRIIKREVKRSRGTHVLESINPSPSTGTYARVISWIDTESNGILQAEAYDARGRRAKVFVSGAVRKVRGQWQLEEMEITNELTGSRTTIEFRFD